MKKVEKSHKLLGNLKSQGLSLNTIIIAAIVLIVLVVLWAIFTGRMGVFTKGVKDVEIRCTDDVISGQVSDNKDDQDNLVCPTGKSRIPGTFADIDTTKEICCTA